MNDIIIGRTYRHFKGNKYIILNLGTHTETGERLVIYKKLSDTDNRIWVRPMSMWSDVVSSGQLRFTILDS